MLQFYQDFKMQNKYNNAVIKNINEHAFFLLYLRISKFINIFNYLFYLLFLNKNTKQNIAQKHLKLQLKITIFY